MPVTLEHLRRLASAQTLGPPTTLPRALERLGFVQADPIRAPARAQDLILGQRVAGYRVGDLERRYPRLAVAEDFFLNYGFVSRRLQALLHPRPDPTVLASGGQRWPADRVRRARRILRFIAGEGEVHPRVIEERFGHGSVTNYWGGTSNATTQLLDEMHYRGLLRVARREGGVRLYAAHAHLRPRLGADERRARLDALVDVVLRLHAPLPAPSLGYYVRRLRYAAPQWRSELTSTLARARERLVRARVDGVDWYLRTGAPRAPEEEEDRVRLLAPFDPVVHDRARFELLWGFRYRFEAYTPASKRTRGYYALPLLFRDRVVGWANVTGEGEELDVRLGYASGAPPPGAAYARALDDEVERMRLFLRPRRARSIAG